MREFILVLASMALLWAMIDLGAPRRAEYHALPIPFFTLLKILAAMALIVLGVSRVL